MNTSRSSQGHENRDRGAFGDSDSLNAWNQLVTLARTETPPAVDVRQAVMGRIARVMVHRPVMVRRLPWGSAFSALAASAALVLVALWLGQSSADAASYQELMAGVAKVSSLQDYAL